MKNMVRNMLIAVAVLVCVGIAGARDAFIVGVAPHTSARVILETYQPLRVYLEKALAMPVEIRTATDFTDFVKRAVAQEYDIAITTGHQARLLETDAKYLPLLTYKAGFKAVAIVALKGPIRKAKDLKGTNVLGLSASSLVTLWGQHWMAENGLAATPIKYVSASDSVAQLVISGEASAGFTSLANFEVLNPEVRGQLRILAESPPMAGRVYVLNSRDAAGKTRINAALWGFAKSPEGKRYFETKKLDGYRKLKAQELESMDPYAAEVRRVLAKEEK
jgi:phosphonate transport system substrate-binding protein